MTGERAWSAEDDEGGETHNNGNKWVLESLIIHLSVNVYAREPASVARMRMVPSDDIFYSFHLVHTVGLDGSSE